MGMVSGLSAIWRQFCIEKSTWEFDFCPLSGIKKHPFLRGWFSTTAMLISIRNTELVERLSASRRVCYRRLDCILSLVIRQISKLHSRHVPPILCYYIYIPYFTAEVPMSNKRPPLILAKKSCVGLIALELAPTVNYWFST